MLPRLLTDFDPLPGLLKADCTDFVVDEIPLYPASGEGSHTYFLLEKTGLATMPAVADLAHHLGVPRHAIGFAGLKDARAVTRQWMSVEHVEPQRLEKLEIPRLRILETTRHNNKLRQGHLKGNRFQIRVRQTHVQRLAQAQQALATLCEKGVPNYFGPQRFGVRGDTGLVGQALLRDDVDAAVDLILGRPSDADTGKLRHARDLYEHGHYEEAARLWPSMFRDERRALKTLAQKGKKRRALAAIDRRTREFYVSAYQSLLFNKVVAQRLPEGLDRLVAGDLAWIHVAGKVFLVEDAAAEQPRADSFDISATGPLFGYRMTEPTGVPGEREAAILAEEGLEKNVFKAGAHRVKGSRRPLRFPISDANIALGADERGPYLELTFTLPRGCYATAVLRELFVEQTTASLGGEDD